MPTECFNENKEIYGRYFGICNSYHHSKGCLCRTCPSYPGEGMMFCARYRPASSSMKMGCMCLKCHTHKIFSMEGDYFCL